MIGGLQEALDRPDRRPSVLAVRRRTGGGRSRDLRRGAPTTACPLGRRGQNAEDEISIAKALAMSLAVAGVTTAFSAGERKLADRIAWAASRVLPGNESLWRPLGHVASLAALTAGTRFAMERGFGMIEAA